MIRKPAVAGMFYPSDPNQLLRLIEWSINHEFGPKGRKSEKVVAAVSPHAGYVYSGPAAAWTYSRIKDNRTFIIIGPNHTGYGYGLSIMTKGIWKTPLGDAYIDEDIGKEIIENSKFLKEDIFAHMYEHSIEVQLPFLQYFFEEIYFVPIVISHEFYKKEYLTDIIYSLKSIKKDIIVIASSDFTHYGYNYGYAPYGIGMEAHEKAKEDDLKAIDLLLKSGDNFLKFYEEKNLTICGAGPIYIAREFSNEGKLLKYYTSAEITGDYNFWVGYASIIFK